MALVLFGFPGSGKTFLGSKFALKIGWQFVDTDRYIEALYAQRHGSISTTRAIYQKEGKEYFRLLESEAISLLVPDQNRVLSVGGGTVLDRDNVLVLETLGLLVYLKSEKKVIKERMLAASPPAFLDHTDLEGSFEIFYQERKAHYEKIATISIDLKDKTEEEVLQELYQTCFN